MLSSHERLPLWQEEYKKFLKLDEESERYEEYEEKRSALIEKLNSVLIKSFLISPSKYATSDNKFSVYGLPEQFVYFNISDAFKAVEPDIEEATIFISTEDDMLLALSRKGDKQDKNERLSWYRINEVGGITTYFNLLFNLNSYASIRIPIPVQLFGSLTYFPGAFQGWIAGIEPRYNSFHYSYYKTESARMIKELILPALLEASDKNGMVIGIDIGCGSGETARMIKSKDLYQTYSDFYMHFSDFSQVNIEKMADLKTGDFSDRQQIEHLDMQYIADSLTPYLQKIINYPSNKHKSIESLIFMGLGSMCVEVLPDISSMILTLQGIRTIIDRFNDNGNAKLGLCGVKTIMLTLYFLEQFGFSILTCKSYDNFIYLNVLSTNDYLDFQKKRLYEHNIINLSLIADPTILLNLLYSDSDVLNFMQQLSQKNQPLTIQLSMSNLKKPVLDQHLLDALESYYQYDTQLGIHLHIHDTRAGVLLQMQEFYIMQWINSTISHTTFEGFRHVLEILLHDNDRDFIGSLKTNRSYDMRSFAGRIRYIASILIQISDMMEVLSKKNDMPTERKIKFIESYKKMIEEKLALLDDAQLIIFLLILRRYEVVLDMVQQTKKIAINKIYADNRNVFNDYVDFYTNYGQNPAPFIRMYANVLQQHPQKSTSLTKELLLDCLEKNNQKATLLAFQNSLKISPNRYATFFSFLKQPDQAKTSCFIAAQKPLKTSSYRCGIL